MAGSLIGIGCRTLLATVLVLTAWWKLTNEAEFEASFRRLAPTAMHRLAPAAAWIIAATEGAVAFLLLAGTEIRPLALLGPLAGCALVGSFTIALARGGDERGCGCWYTPASIHRKAKLVPIGRNFALLAALIAAAVLSSDSHHVGVVAAMPPIVAGLILAALLIQAPQIVAAVTFDPPVSGVR